MAAEGGSLTSPEHWMDTDPPTAGFSHSCLLPEDLDDARERDRAGRGEQAFLGGILSLFVLRPLKKICARSGYQKLSKQYFRRSWLHHTYMAKMAGAAFRRHHHHREPSCQLPQRKMGSPGTGVHAATALGVLWFCFAGTALEVQVPENPVVALVGADTTLRCSFSPEPGFSLAQLNLIWQLTDTKQLVHSFAQGQDQGSAYANRTALFPDLLAQGNASLRLQRVRVADEGSFTCFVSVRDFGSAAVSLQVAAPYSKPSMTLEPNKDLRPGDMVTITCASSRGYPEAEVFWQDGQGVPLAGNVTTSQMANEQGLFDVRSVLRVALGANGTYSCLVRNPVLQQDAHGSVAVTGQPVSFPPEALWVTVGLSICLVALLVALAFVCWRKIKQSCEEENAGAEDQDGDGEGSKTVLRPLKHSENKEGDGQEIA